MATGTEVEIYVLVNAVNRRFMEVFQVLPPQSLVITNLSKW